MFDVLKEKGNVRAQAIMLFGNLSAFGDGPSKQPFLEQIHSNFVSLLLHLNDQDNDVKKVRTSLIVLCITMMVLNKYEDSDNL